MITRRFCRALLFAALCLLLLSLSACSQLEALLPRHSYNGIEVVQLIASADANQSTAITTDVVFIFDEMLAGQITPLTARRWFQQKNQVQLQYPGLLEIFSYELLPNSHQSIDMNKERSRFKKPSHKAIKVVAFANYIQESSDYTLDISSFKQPIITLDNSQLRIAEGKRQ